MGTNRWVRLIWLAVLGILAGTIFMAGMSTGENKAARNLEEAAWAYCTADQQAAEVDAAQCQEDLASERKLKLDALAELRRTQQDRDSHYEDELGCYQEVFELKQRMELIPIYIQEREGLFQDIESLELKLAQYMMMLAQAKDELSLYEARIEELTGCSPSGGGC